MSQENVDVVRTALGAFNRGDFDTAISLFHPEVEWYPYLGALEGSVYRGREALLGMWTELNENLGGRLQLEAEELIDLGQNVVVVVEARGIGTASGAEVRQSWAQLATMRDGLIFRVEPFAEKTEALEAAGLSE